MTLARQRFGSCLLHLTIFVSLKIFDMVSSEVRTSMLCLIIPNTSLFLGLWVQIKGSMSSVPLLFTSKSLSLNDFSWIFSLNKCMRQFFQAC